MYIEATYQNFDNLSWVRIFPTIGAISRWDSYQVSMNNPKLDDKGKDKAVQDEVQ